MTFINIKTVVFQCIVAVLLTCSCTSKQQEQVTNNSKPEHIEQGEQPAPKKKKNKKVSKHKDKKLWDYNFKFPAQRIDLPPILQEVSGIAYWKENTIIAVQDESGILFFFDIKTEKITNQLRFAGEGDYEGIALKDNSAYVIRSDGKLFEIDLSSEKTKSYQLPFNGNNDIEGLTLSADKEYLLITPKANSGLKGKKTDTKRVYQWHIEDTELDKSPLIKIKPKDFNNVNKKASKEFMPSAIGVHPVTNAYYILAHRGKKIAIYTPEKELRAVHLLKKEIYFQPEGIAFLPDGDMIIASEGGMGKGYLILLPYQDKNYQY